MADNIGEQASPPTIPRRSAIKIGLALGAGLAIDQASRNLSELSSPQIPHPEAETEIPDEETIYRFLFLNYTEEEKIQARAKIEEVKKHHFNPRGFQDLAKNRFQPKYKLINEAAALLQSRGFEIDQSWISLMKGLILIESSFLEKAVGKNGDKGLCQLLPDSEKEAAEFLGLEDYNVMDGKTNASLGFCYLMLKFRQMNDPGLAILAYNKGAGGIEDMFRQTLNLPSEPFSQIVSDKKLNPLDLKEENMRYFYDVAGATLAVLEADRRNNITPQTRV